MRTARLALAYAAASLAAPSPADARPDCRPIVLDFDVDADGAPVAAGTVVSDEWRGLGVEVRVEARHPRDTDVAAVFDTGRPTPGEFELGTPNVDFGGPGRGRGGRAGAPGANDAALGHVLVIPHHVRDRDGDGRLDRLRSNPRGGTITLRFDEPATLFSLDLLDIDPDEAGTAVVARTADGGAHPVPFEPLGDNAVQRLAVDREGVVELVVDLAGTGAFARVEWCDVTPPEIAIVDPPAGAVFSEQPITVRGTVSDPRATVTVNDRPATVAGETFEVTGVPLAEGANTLLARATDRSGNVGEAATEVLFDGLPPIFVALEPGDGDTVRVLRPPIRAVFFDVTSGVDPLAPGAIRVLLDGVDVTDAAVADEASVEVIPPTDLAEGAHHVRVEVVDRAGHVGAVEWSFTVAFVPRITITDPPNLSVLGTSPVEVRGTLPLPAARVTVNGVEATIEAGNTWRASVPLGEGGNTLVAVSEGLDGRTGSTNVRVTLDTKPPRLVVDTPPDGSATTAEQVTVTGRVHDVVVGTVNRVQARVFVNGVEAAVANRGFAATGIALAPGANTIEIVAEDRVGNRATRRVTVIREEPTGRRLVAVSGDGQEGPIRGRLPEPLVVQALDADGSPVAGVPVVFRVVHGDGVLTANGRTARAVAATTDAQGRAAATWTLGTYAAAAGDRVEARATGFAGTAYFSATGRAAAPTVILVDNGDAQVGAVGQPLPRPLVAVVTDAFHNRVEGVPVTFTVVEGGGLLGDGRRRLTVFTDSDGLAAVPFTLGLEERVEGNRVEADFVGNGGRPASFVATGLVPGDPADTRVAGVVLDNTDTPLRGVTVSIVGTDLSMVTGPDGRFDLGPAPVGQILVAIDGRTIQGARPWPLLTLSLETVPGRVNTFGMPVYLAVLDTEHAIHVDEDTGGTVTLSYLPGVSFTVLPGSATFAGGARSGLVSVSVVHGDKVPRVPDFGAQPRLVLTLQPPSARFDPPAILTMPNVDGLRPGQVVEFSSFDLDLGQFVTVGTGSVSDDGTVIRSDPGMGTFKGGWHYGAPPLPTGGVGACPPCQKLEDGVCQPDLAQLTSPCDDGDACTDDDQCQVDGTCRGTPRVCAPDGNPCTRDVCEDGECYAPDDGATCNDDCQIGGGRCVGDRCVNLLGPSKLPGQACDPGAACLDAECVLNLGSVNCEVTGPSPESKSCDDGDACTVADLCDGAGACTGVEVSCGTCEVCAGGECVPAADGTLCDTANVCELGVCQGGLCVPFTDKSSSTPCDDGDPCTENDRCVQDFEGTCRGTPIECGDCQQCVDGVCESACGDCETCQDGACAPAPENGCDDGDPCTVDSCGADGTCRSEPIECAGCQRCVDGQCVEGCGTCERCEGDACVPDAGATCDDGDPCTEGDTCTADGQCKGAPLSCGPCQRCEDGQCVEACGPCDRCEGDVCVPDVGRLCDDGDPCTENDACRADGVCAGTEKECVDDDEFCTLPGCNFGQCNFPLTGVRCDDGNDCTEPDVCIAGTCLGDPADPLELPPTRCDDGDDNLCTQGVCVLTECVSLPVGEACRALELLLDCRTNCRCEDPSLDNPNPCVCDPSPDGSACDDDLFCNGAGSCQEGDCVQDGVDPCAGGPDCRNLCNEEEDNCLNPPGSACTDDGNPCTTDLCDGQGNCVHAVREGPCDDGDFCTVGDTCDPDGRCVPEGFRDCSDDIACTIDLCDPDERRCVQLPDHPACDDGNPCTADRCDVVEGCVHEPIDGACDDDDPCTEADRCEAGACVGTPKVCPAEDPICTAGVCDPATGICRVVPTNDGGACDDGDPCTVDDTCAGGTCAGAPLDCSHLDNTCAVGVCDPATGQCVPERDDSASCDDGNVCTDDRCDLAIGCVNEPNEVACDDLDPGTVGDVCIDGACQGFTYLLRIDEVVTDPRSDWSGGDPFDAAPGAGAIDAGDEYVEIRNLGGPVPVRDLVLRMNDGAPADHVIGGGGAVEVYSEGSTPDFLLPDGVLVIGDPPGEMDDAVRLEVRLGDLVLADLEVGGAGAPGGPSTGPDDEAIRRVADTGDDAADFVRGPGDPGVPTGPGAP